MFVRACIIYWLDLNDLLNIISLICSILCACYTICVVRVFFVIEGHIVNKLCNLIMLPSRNKVIIFFYYYYYPHILSHLSLFVVLLCVFISCGWSATEALRWAIVGKKKDKYFNDIVFITYIQTNRNHYAFKITQSGWNPTTAVGINPSSWNFIAFTCIAWDWKTFFSNHANQTNNDVYQRCTLDFTQLKLISMAQNTSGYILNLI